MTDITFAGTSNGSARVFPAAPDDAQRPALPDHSRRPTPAPLATGARIAQLLADLGAPVGADAGPVGEKPDVVGEFELRPTGLAGEAFDPQAVRHDTDRAGCLKRFWAEVEATGTPLVEPAERDEERIVTFLLRDATAGEVVLIGNRITDLNELETARLKRIPGTDVWWLGLRLRADWRGAYQLAILPERVRPATPWAGPDRESWKRLYAAGRADPLNPSIAPNKFAAVPFRAFSLAELPDAPAQPWRHPRPDVVPGPLTEHAVPSSALGGPRRVWVHRPPAGIEPAGLLILMDGDVWSQPHSPIAPTLDSLRATGRIPALTTVMIDSVDPARRAHELACSESFVRFLTDELMPWIARHGAPPADPARTVLAGQSLGGLTSLYAAARAPHLFGNVLSQSGSFWWPGGDPIGDSAQWLTRTLARTPRLPLAVDLEIGLLEWQLLEPTRHLRSVLQAKGYPLTYREFYGGHDQVCWRGGIADGLTNLTARWAPAYPAATDDDQEVG